MPTSLTDAFSTLKTEPPAPPTGDPAEVPAKVGRSAADVFKTLPQPKGLKERLAPAATKAKDLGTVVATQGLKPYLDDAIQWAHEYGNALHEDLKAYPEGTGNQLLQSLKTVNDAIGFVSGPAMSPLYTGVINPVKEAIQKLGDQVKKVAADDYYDAQARREGYRGQQYPKGVDWKVHQADVQRTIEELQTAAETVVTFGAGLIGGKPTEKMPVERPMAHARAALRDMSDQIKPPTPKLEPINVSLDKTMGFQKIRDAVPLEKVPVGSTRTAAAILDEMIPHAEGYAKSFLEKLSDHIDPNTPVRFKAVAGTDARYKGVYLVETHQIELKAGHADALQTFVHESVHATTTRMIDSLVDADMNALRAELGKEPSLAEKLQVLNHPRSPVLKELDAMVQEGRVRAMKAGRHSFADKDLYGLRGNIIKDQNKFGPKTQIIWNRVTARHEFIAEAFSNPAFQEFLANSEKYASVGYKFKNMMNQLGALISRHLGFDKPQEQQLLNQAMRVGSQLMRMQSVEKPEGKHIFAIMGRLENGETITRGDLQSATRHASLEADVRRTKTALQISMEQVLRAVSPESLGRNAKLAASAIASRITERMQKDATWQHGSEVRQKFWRSRPDFTSEFIKKFEKGESFSDPVLQQLAERYRAWGRDIAEHDAKLGFSYEPRENYLAHIFEDEEGVANYFQRKYGSKFGDPGFVKDRTFNLYQEAIEAGFRPRYDNPEDIMLVRQHASDIAAMHVSILKDLEHYGLATKKIAGGERIVKTVGPDKKVSLSIEKTEGTKQPEGTVRWRSPNGEVYWVDKHADAVLQNAFKSKSLWEDKGGLGLVFRGAMGLKNTLVPIRLALSLFHPLHVVGIDASAGMTRAFAGMLSGTTPIHKGFAELLKSGLGYKAIWENPKAGWRVMKAWQGRIPKEMLTDEDARALQTLIEMGISPDMSVQYRTNARQNFLRALQDTQASFRQGRGLAATGDATRAVWHLPWATISALSKPIFEVWIPALKAASALKDAENLLKRNPELASDDAARHMAMRKLGKSVENRYGEMNYSTLFWKRWVKDLSVLDTLSLGWQLGFIREYGGGALELGQWAKSGDKFQQIKKGQLDRAIFVASYTTLGAGVAGLMTWAMTGEAPSSLLDYISPRTGEKNPDGTDARVSTMFYSREFAALYKHIQNEGVVPGVSQLVLNKGSGLFGLMHEWATGVNGFGQEIRDPNSDAFTKLEQTLAYSMSDIEPISMKAIQENITEQPVKSGVLTVLGFTPAPKYLTETKTDASIKMAFRNYVAPKQTPFERAEFSKEYTKLRAAYQQGSEDFGPQLDKFSEQYELSGQDQRRLMRSLNSTLTPTQRMFMRLPWQEQIKVLDAAPQEERDQLLPHANREHVRNKWTPPE